MKIEKITEFFYAKASKRIADKVNHSKLTHTEIYRNGPKQISWIINNKKTKNNRFLICDAIFEVFDKDEDNSFGLIPKLKFANRQEILWGNENEILSYLPELFKILWEEVTENDSEYSIDKELYLCDYIPYAKYSSYWNILFESNNHYPALFYGLYEDDIVNNLDSARNGAFRYLYKKCAVPFANIFHQFTATNDSFHKLDKILKEKFIDSLFVSMLNDLKPNEFSLGLRVKNLIYADLSKCAKLITNHGLPNNISSQLINASSAYIIALEKIQNEIIECESL